MCCCKSLGRLSRLGVLCGVGAFAALLAAFLGGSWLHTREPITLLNSQTVTSVKFQIGLWKVCHQVKKVNGTSVPNPKCFSVKYSGWSEIRNEDIGMTTGLDLAQVFISRMRSCTVLCGMAVGLLLLALLFAMVGHCNGDNKTIIACGLFILGGLSLGTGLVVFASSLSETLMEISQYHKEPPTGPLYDYRYGWCFFTAGIAFIMTNMAAVFSISGYLNRFSSVDEMIIKKKFELEKDVNRRNKKLALLDPFIENPKITQADIRNEISTFTLAGAETTATTLNFVAIVLGMYPHIQQKVYEEITDIFGTKGPVTAEGLTMMNYTERVIKETQRIFPTIPFIAREASEDIQLDGKIIPAGSVVAINIITLHRNPKYWTDPLKFDPDRFLPEENAQRNPYAYIPFSQGIRKCIGWKYAMLNMKTVLIEFLRNFEIHTEYKSIDEISLQPLISLHIEDGSKLWLEKRKINVRQMVPGAERKLREHQHLSTEYLVKHSGPVSTQYDSLTSERPKYEAECGPLLNKTPPDVCTTNKCHDFTSTEDVDNSCMMSNLVETSYSVAQTLAGQTVPITIKNCNSTAPLSFSNLPIKYGTMHFDSTRSQCAETLHQGFLGISDLGSSSSTSSSGYCGKSKTLQLPKTKRKCANIETFQVPETSFDFGKRTAGDFSFSGSAV